MSHPLLRGQSSNGLLPKHQRVRDQLEQEKVPNHSANINNESLKIRADAARRISAIEPPHMDELEIPENQVQTIFRKSSEVFRPEFKIREEVESCGIFASGIIKEKQQDVRDEGVQGDKTDKEETDKKTANMAGRFGFMEERTRSSDGFSFSFLDRSFEKCDGRGHEDDE